MYNLFLDDERYPVDKNDLIARNVDDAMWYIRTRGLPIFMSLDHDLGYGKMTGMDFVKILCAYIQDNDLDISNTTYYIHSQNPVGAKNMQTYLDQFWQMSKK